MAHRVVSVETKNSKINLAMGRQIRAEKAGMTPEPTVAELAPMTGLSPSTINRIISEDPRDIHVTAIARFAAVFGISPETLVRRAIERAGGMDAILADGPDLTSPRTSEESAKVTPIGKRPQDMTGDELDAYQGSKAADRLDEEADAPDGN